MLSVYVLDPCVTLLWSNHANHCVMFFGVSPAHPVLIARTFLRTTILFCPTGPPSSYHSSYFLLTTTPFPPPPSLYSVGSLRFTIFSVASFFSVPRWHASCSWFRHNQQLHPPFGSPHIDPAGLLSPLGPFCGAHLSGVGFRIQLFGRSLAPQAGVPLNIQLARGHSG